MTRVRSVLWGALAALAAGCTMYSGVETFKKPDGDLTARQGFYWKGGDFATAAQLDPGAITLAETQVRNAVVAELTRRGYVEKPQSAGAELAVAFQVSGVRRFETLETPRVGAPSPNQVLTPGQIRPPPASTVPREITVREGSVVLTITDAASNELLWRGETSTETRARNYEQAARTIAQMARQIAMQVPPHTGGAR
jgi:hypothetical protein